MRPILKGQLALDCVKLRFPEIADLEGRLGNGLSRGMCDLRARGLAQTPFPLARAGRDWIRAPGFGRLDSLAYVAYRYGFPLEGLLRHR